MSLLTYNERSWAIDLISEINLILAKQPSVISRAGGESGLKAPGTTLFPDVILFSGATSVLQGWELKMPDTALTNGELIANAQKKANLFNTNSYLLWNGPEAALYARDTRDAEFVELKAWHRAGLDTRRDVGQNKAAWAEMLVEILRDLDHFLETGAIRRSQLDNFDDESFATNLVESLYRDDAEAIKNASFTDQTLRSEIDTWAGDSGVTDKFNELAKLNILSWANRFVFCHYLARYNSAALEVSKIDSNCDADAAYEIFKRISSVMDFSNVFVPGIADKIMSTNGWEGRVAFNRLLVAAGLSKLPESSMRNVLDGYASIAKRRSQGQFATPPKLARALAWLALNDITKPSWDPCCGSGTVAKALYEVRVSAGLERQRALEQVWASDKQQMPLQLTSMNLSDPQAIESVVQVFQANVFDAATGMNIELTDPKNPGNTVRRSLPKMAAIASNLPYVRQEISDKDRQLKVFSRMEAEKLIPSAKKFGKADTYSSIILDLEHHLEENGRLVVVISNAWLANEWGRAFKQALAHKFRIVSVVRSGSGRWFQNAEVVTTILVLEKSITGTPPSWPISFVTTNKPLPAWDDTYLAAITNASHKGVRTSDIEVNVVPFDVCEFNSDNGFHWRINFTNSDWLTALIPMTKPISDYFDVARGARTGLDDFFYPGPQDARLIEDAYLVPVVSSSKATRYLKIDADKVAFCCTLPKNELHRLGHKGALAWIEKFENRVNSTSQKPIWEHLAKSKSEWYSLDPNEQGEFAMSLNPGESLPVFRAPSPVFMNQRLTRLTSKSSDPDLLHALMNSVAGMLGMEFLGFGRGQGALDLSSNRVKDSLRMLNPQIVTPAGRAEILDAFAPLLLREFLPIGRELQEADRKHFDRVVLKNFGLESHQESMYSAIKAAVLDRSNTR